MVGLVFAEPLRLTFPQWFALGFNTAAWLWWYASDRRHPCRPVLERGHPVRIPPLRGAGGCFLLTALLTFGALWAVFL